VVMVSACGTLGTASSKNVVRAEIHGTQFRDATQWTILQHTRLQIEVGTHQYATALLTYQGIIAYLESLHFTEAELASLLRQFPTLDSLRLEANNGWRIQMQIRRDSLDRVAEATRLENLRADSVLEARRTPRERLIRQTVSITRLNTSGPNSVGGVDVSLSLNNLSTATIKYVTIVFHAHNAVNDRVRCEIRRTSRLEGLITGPIAPAQSRISRWDCAWYNYSIDHVEISSIRIEYMDGSIFTLNAQDILWVISNEITSPNV
jgi:hypothetical protein